MRSAIIFCCGLLAVILDGFAHAHADGIQIHEATHVTSRGPLVVKAFLAEGQGPHPAIIVLHGSQVLVKYRWSS